MVFDQFLPDRKSLLVNIGLSSCRCDKSNDNSFLTDRRAEYFIY